MTYSKLIKSVAMHCIAEATQETTSGNYIIYLEDLTKLFGVSLKLLFNSRKDIMEAIYEFVCVSDVEYDYADDGFDINLYTDYCLNDIE